jgi:ribosome-binding protein aMBF1 (putative translation factor)
MSTVIADEVLNDPSVLAVAVLVDRIRTLSREDRDDLFALFEALAVAETEEERDAAACGMCEILRQQKSQARPMDLGGEPSEGLQRWMGFVSERIRHFREEAGLTQQELAEKTGLRQSHISRLEQAHHSPSALTLEKIAGALGIAVSELDPSQS